MVQLGDLGHHRGLARHRVRPTTQTHTPPVRPATSAALPSSEPSWSTVRRALPLNRLESAAPGLLLGWLAENASDGNCSHFSGITTGYLLCWAFVRAESDTSPLVKANAKTEADQTQSRNRNVSTFARVVERGRALAAARNAPSQSQQLSYTTSEGLYLADSTGPKSATQSVTHLQS